MVSAIERFHCILNTLVKILRLYNCLLVQYLDDNYTHSIFLKFFLIQVVLYNRRDCCSERLSNAQVTVGDAADGKGNALCGNAGVTKGKWKIEVNCAKKLEGRYVTVTVANGALTLCEVEVIGKASSKPNHILCK